ncbi:hypothetical protein [Lysobacter gummosus]|uniref:hypothetical protein n=1 Tax=Lysobacter gummosus TaxID=262324 RepID=UPI00362C1E74
MEPSASCGRHCASCNNAHRLCDDRVVAEDRRPPHRDGQLDQILAASRRANSDADATAITAPTMRSDCVRIAFASFASHVFCVMQDKRRHRPPKRNSPAEAGLFDRSRGPPMRRHARRGFAAYLPATTLTISRHLFE